MSKIFRRAGLSYPLELSFARVGKHEHYPWIRPTHFIKTMARCGDLGKFLGGKPSLKDAGPLLKEFWRRYKLAFPQHEVFTKEIPLERAVPLYLHGDEGQTYKKSGVLLVSFQGVIGFGSKRTPSSSAQIEDEAFLEKAGIPVNFLKTGLQSRFLCGIAPKAGAIVES